MNYPHAIGQPPFYLSSSPTHVTVPSQAYGIELTVPIADLSEVPLSPPSAETPLLGRRRISIFRGGVLSGVIGATGFLSSYLIILGFRNNNIPFILIGLYGAVSSLAEARRLNRASVTTLSRYEEGTLLSQIYILCVSLLTQQCITLFCVPHRRSLPVVAFGD